MTPADEAAAKMIADMEAKIATFTETVASDIKQTIDTVMVQHGDEIEEVMPVPIFRRIVVNKVLKDMLTALSEEQV